MTNFQNKTLIVFAIMLTAILTILESCSYKEELTVDRQLSNEKIETRSFTNEELDWLIDFQYYLYRLQNNQSATNIYEWT